MAHHTMWKAGCLVNGQAWPEMAPADWATAHDWLQDVVGEHLDDAKHFENGKLTPALERVTEALQRATPGVGLTLDANEFAYFIEAIPDCYKCGGLVTECDCPPAPAFREE